MGILLSLLGLKSTQDVIKYGLMLLALAALLFGVYMWGNGNGKALGYKEGWDAQQVTVDKLTKTINDSRTATADKIVVIEKQATAATVTAVKQLAVNSSKRTAIVQAFQKTEPTPVCGLTKPAVESINALLSTQAGSSDPDPPTDSTPSNQPNQTKTEVADEIL